MSKLFDKGQDLTLVLGMILILVILFSPIPPALLDLAIIVNFGFGLTILLLTFYVGKPVEFSTFPSLLLVATLYRLSLNVAATRLILTGADAGAVIDSIGAYAVQGNFVIGIVVFLILIVVQYVVVTAGAQRVSEVAARFTLDSMPGQQMSIDADLNMGLIDQKEAVRRRAELEKQAGFYGSMDGASKFVKGDAVAGIIILLIDIIAGLVVGVMQMGMSWSEAMQRFTLLTIGDGIATQLPALIISIATGIIVTRSSADRQLGAEIFRQLATEPRIPLIVTIVLTALLFMPGMPKWPIVLIAGLAFFAWLRIRARGRQLELEAETRDDPEAEGAGGNLPPTIEIRLGAELSAVWKEQSALIMDRIGAARRTHELSYGIGFPAVRLADGDGLGGLDYQIMLFGSGYASGTLHPERLLVISGGGKPADIEGVPGADPAFNLPGVWIEPGLSEEARAKGYTVIDPLTVMLTHFGEVVRTEAATLLTRAAVVKLMEDVRERQPSVVEELIPNCLTMSDVQRVLQNLLAEGVSIANIDLIVEHLADLARSQKDPVELTEQVRQRMSFAICHQLRGRHPDLAVLSLDPRIENQILGNVKDAAGTPGMALEPSVAEKLLRSLAPLADKMMGQGRTPVLLCSGEIRRYLHGLTRRALPRLAILSVNEIPVKIDLSSFDIVRIEA
ncbi:flagellar biosynthesis protein FlhA [Novosphingopyxis sp.]|uniref:flagellar biosynthesis protein FlhA n=1 Tax=Novosphingopyxis sp. TaxID=2709690 RepID=UPI003B5A96A5